MASYPTSDDGCRSLETSTQGLTALKPPTGQTARTRSARRQHSSQIITTMNNDILVYIPDIPLDIPEKNLEQMIQNRVETAQRMKLSDVKCYLNLGVAMVRLMNEEDKRHLVVTVRSIVFDDEQKTNISFVDELDLDTYIVFDSKMPTLPSSDDVARHWMQAYKTQELRRCEPVSIQFPNIFRIFLTTIEELVKAANAPDFTMKNTSAVVYPRADCSFFEDLPTTTNHTQLSSAIAAQITENNLRTTSFYVDYKKETGNAVVLVTKSAKKWMCQGFLSINGRNIPKKAKLAYRVVVSSVPRNFDLVLILTHPLFDNHVVTHHHINEHLILELDSLHCYEHCISMGAFRIDNNIMSVTQHTVLSDPGSCEIDAENWYNTAMLDIKPDIVTIISDPKQPILRYRWNAANWLEQMKRVEGSGPRSKKYDLQRHLLRVTVMLNTIAVIRRKKYLIDGNEVALKSNPMRTIGYDHRSKLSYGRTISKTDMKTPYTSTTVSVVNEDCLILYEKLVAEGYKPVLLNMANATSPGGGYRKGDGAQEENLFRRSDYYQSLDLEIADKDRSERLYCTPKCDWKRPTGYADLYPMEEFGAIYTSGITVFRGTETTGYPYLQSPLYDVCAIAMAAYRNPELNRKNMLSDKFAINTRKKIENIFAIAHHHHHDCLVLSALGCGAFNNPPEHIARLFKSVIYQYAGYFKKIYFAIIDDHNTGNLLNPKGNFLPFQQLLDGIVVHPPKITRVNGMLGPNLILNESSSGGVILSDACVLYLPPCHHGSQCRDLQNSKHTDTFTHPPVCLQEDTTSSCDQISDEVHMFTFLHHTKCKFEGKCDNMDPKHFNEYKHPDFCKDASGCIDISPEHLFAYRHLPICPEGLTCPKFLEDIQDHCTANRHCRSVCPHDNCCVYFHDKEHMSKTIHSFRTVCPFTPYTCLMYVEYLQPNNTTAIFKEVQKHCLQYSHVCLYGRQCKTKDAIHLKTTIHVARLLCPDQDKCSKLTQEDHLDSFSHSGIRDIRLLCRDAGFECPDKSHQKHLKTYRHGKNHNQHSVALSSNLNSSIDFVHNQGHIIRAVNNYAQQSNWTKAKISDDILAWIRALPPVHRCGKVIFESILLHGHVMSRHYMKLLRNPKKVAKAVSQHSRVRLIFFKNDNPAVKENASRYIAALVESEFAKSGADAKTAVDADHGYNIKMIEKTLKPSLSDHDIGVIRHCTIQIAQASIKLCSDPMGIGYAVDKACATDQHVFSILGPHCGYYYGDIVIVFKKEIMFHPDANFSIQAATSFYSGSTYKYRLWSKDPGTPDERVRHFNRSKLHCSVPRYEYAAAAELVAITGQNQRTMAVDLRSIIQRWMNVDAHEVFEGHLPPLIPLDYIDYVYMPTNVFDSLTPNAQRSAREVFKKSLILTNHDVDLSLLVPGGTVPFDNTRKPYQMYVLEKISEKIEQTMTAPHTLPEVVITVPASKFEELILMPVTISQSYYLFSLDRVPAPNSSDVTYIYWQAINGDMMLTLSNEKIKPAEEQRNLRCLVCYVAKKPAHRDDYHEEYSYLNNCHPNQHYTNVYAGQFKAKSNVFYRGCNTDDFLTFCLKISPKTGEAILSQAGPNSIYNHDKIRYRFNRSDLDLSKLDFIHIAAGTEDVPVRNLIIRHEPMPELHPSFDKNFKIDTSALKHERRASVDDIVRTPQSSETHKKDATPKLKMKRAASSADLSGEPEKPSFFRRIKNAIFGPSKRESSCEKTPSTPDPTRSNPPKYSPPSTKRSASFSSELHSQVMSSCKLPLCRDSVYCLQQNSKDHTEQYAHLCRYNELCQRKASEPHLIHESHRVPKCSDGDNCAERVDPVHRAMYRHVNLPDYLFPCRFQENCYNKSFDHRLRYFHGEELPSIKSEFSPNQLSDHPF